MLFRTEGLPQESGEYICLVGTWGGMYNLPYSARHKLFNCYDEYSEEYVVEANNGIKRVKAWCPRKEFFEAMGWDKEFMNKEEYVHE